jgi:hypothetical protein
LAGVVSGSDWWLDDMIVFPPKGHWFGAADIERRTITY